MIESVGYDDEISRSKAQSIADSLNYTLDKDANTCLYVSENKLSLKIGSFSLLSADFNASTWQKRKAEGKKQGLVRACKPKPGLKIIDATAGWGRDAAILASFGAEVLMIERHPAMAALLEEALSCQNELDKQQMHLSLVTDDTRFYLSQLQEQDYPDIIYIDPMHPQRNKSALVKKDMQALQYMVGPDDDALELIKYAITKVKQKVVVKWPQKLKPLLQAHASIEGKTVRFDSYWDKPANSSGIPL
jgi:16S rRNA (guanine1516-N2)-methyltransferase